MAKDAVNRPASPWLKRVLIPFWVVQLGLMTFVLVLTIWLVTIDYGSFSIAEVLIIIFCIASIIFDLTEIILFARRKLRQLTYLIFQIIKATIWFGIFVAALARGLTQQTHHGVVNTTLTWGVVIDGILFFAFLGSLIYGSVIFHRHRRNKRKGFNAQNITQNPYYNGPYSENGHSTVNYQPVQSGYALAAEVGGSHMYEQAAPAYEVGELPEDHSKKANELSAAPEVHEMFTPDSSTKGSIHR
ncbi:hypothetical protein ACLMJK_000607 [Lecanora helva]